MREIKFRGKMIPEQEWIFGTLLRIPHPPICFGKEEEDKYYIQFADPRYMPDWNMPYKMVQGQVEANTIGQYIGLHDKNGKEIYEGDIVKVIYQNEVEIFEVRYDEENTCFRMYYEDLKFLDFTIEEIDLYEVIGNIYNNPKLLEVQNEQ